MRKQTGKIGTIRKELEGKACPACGSFRYQLVLQSGIGSQGGALFARCSGCHEKRDLEVEDLKTTEFE